MGKKAQFRIVPYRILPKVDWLLLVITLGLLGCGIVTLWGATASGNGPGRLHGYALSQSIWFTLGLGCLGFMVVFNYQRLRRIIWPLYVFELLQLMGLLLKGTTIKGARSWYDLGAFHYQPSDPGKIILILALALYLAPRSQRFRGIRHMIVPSVIAGLPLLLIMLQPALGSAIVFGAITATMFWVAGLRRYVIGIACVLGIGVAVMGYPHLKEYQKARIKTFLEPGADPRGKGWNIMQSMTTLGSGQATGKGWGRGTQTSFKFLPESHTDFIFPTVGEQFGMAGCCTVLVLLGALVLRLIRIANVTQDIFGVLIVTGLAAMFATHTIMNIGMAIGLLPVTGLPLPFFSYGGTFAITCLTSVGLALGIGARREL